MLLKPGLSLISCSVAWTFYVIYLGRQNC